MAKIETNINQLNSDVQAMKSTIIAKGVDVEDNTPLADFAGKIAEVYDKGEKEWWRLFQNNGARNHYVDAFKYQYWTDKVYNPIYPIIAQSYGLQNTYNNSYITDTKVPITVYGQMAGSFTNSSIVTIRKLILNNVTTLTNPFGGCKALKNITLEGEWLKTVSLQDCPLSGQSIINFIEHLSDSAVDQTLTLKKTAAESIVFPVTSEESGVTYTSWDDEGDETSLVNAKPNWKISLL